VVYMNRNAVKLLSMNRHSRIQRTIYRLAAGLDRLTASTYNLVAEDRPRRHGITRVAVAETSGRIGGAQ
jgi:hypothetical protein